MSRYAILENNVVTNIIELEDQNLHIFENMHILVKSDTAGIGDSYINGAFVPNIMHISNTSIIVPQSITRFQALAALHNAGLLDIVQAAITASTDPLVSLAWNNAQTFDRSSPTIASLATSLNLSSTQIDDLFIAGSKLVA